jgi:transcriptional regulator GlxA family with amidase domain
MKQISFLLADGVLKPSSLFSAIEVFEKANDYYCDQGKDPYYDIQIVGSDLSQHLLNTSFTISEIKKIGDVKKTDCIIIPGFEGKDEFAILKSSKAIAWLIEQYKEGAEIASLCTGSFLLAATGLLKGKQCSTHWRAQEVFRRLFPDLDLCTDKVITDSKGLYTAGGAMSCLNLVLYLVEKYNGREVALYCSKVLQIDIERNSQSPFMIFKGQKEHSDEEIKIIQDFIESSIGEKITVDLLADRCSMNRVNFSRRFKRATQSPPIEYIQRVKVEAAKRGLESGRKNISEVMYSVGYADVKAFRAIFKKIAGITPLEYKTKFGMRS